MLDTKNRVYQNLMKTSNNGEKLDIQHLDEEMKAVNDRLEMFL